MHAHRRTAAPRRRTPALPAAVAAGLLLVAGTASAAPEGAQHFGPPIVGVLRFDTLVYRTAREHRVDYALVMAVIHTESLFNPRATSHRGAAGLMQLMPQTAARYGANDRYNPRQNVEAGVRYLKALLKRYGGRLTYAVAAYNAGEDAVDRYHGIPPYAETREYVKRVMRYRKFYENWP